MTCHRSACRIAAASVLLVALASPSANAALFQFTSGSRAAQANFIANGQTLTIILSNTSTADARVPTDILTAVFFDLAGDPSLSRQSVTVTAGSSVVNDPPRAAPGRRPKLRWSGSSVVNDPPRAAVLDVGSEWAYRGNLVGVPGTRYGVSSTGLGLFGPHDRFDTVGNLQGPASPAGVQYGLTTAGDNPATGNGGIRCKGLIRHSVTITLTGLPLGYSTAGVSNVWFQYGTDLSKPRYYVPEPASLGLLALGAAFMLPRHRRANGAA